MARDAPLADAVQVRRRRFLTAEKISELAVDLTNAGPLELNGAERRYRALVEQLPLVSYIERLNEQGAAYVSPQIQDLIGYTAEEWVADRNFFASVLHPDDRARVLDGIAKMHRTGEPFECEYRLTARDGTFVWVHDAAVVVRDEEGVSLYAQGYMIDISDRKRAEAALLASEDLLVEQIQRIEYQALHDPLTGLPNRTLFHDRTNQALYSATRASSKFAVILLDIDRFRELNDTFGHQSGDLLLVDVASRLRAALRDIDTVARLGGDEFAVLAPGIADQAAAREVAEKLRLELLRPFGVGGIEYEVESSIGIALFPEHGVDVESLIRHADVAVSVSKNTHTPTFYAEEHDNHLPARLTLVSELRKAIEGEELVVDYQPQTDVASGEVRKVEALVRWNHPTHGLLAPDEFIPLAEQTGLIRAVTRHVLNAALAQCRNWHQDGRDLTVAVNITNRELVDLKFPDEVAGLLAKWHVSPHHLELEITERTIMTDLPRARSILTRLSELGIRIAIDDFGSGQSSLAYLRGLPLTVLKIDKSFVQRMVDDREDAALVRMAIDLGHNLGLEVVAEGVETEETTCRLEALGCDTLQGYHLGRPQAAAGMLTRPRRRPVREMSRLQPSHAG